MSRNILMVLTALLVWAIHTETVAQSTKYSNEFLSIGVGARALGMSGSIIANSNDVYSAYWNPAGLTELKLDRNLAAMHSEYFAGIAKYDFGSFAAKIDKSSSIALSIIRFGVDDIPETSELIDSEGNIHYDKIKSFSAIDMAFILSYARKLKKQGLSVGGNVKVIRRTAGDFAKSWGFGFDAGIRYANNKWIFGATLRDATSTFNAWSYSLTNQMKEVFTITGNTIPVNTLEVTRPKLLLGGCYKFNLTNSLQLNSELDFDITTDGKRNVLISSDLVSVDPHIGIELGYKNTIFLRGGIGNIQNETDISGVLKKSIQPNIGVGLNIKDFLTIDYAFTDIGNQSLALYSHVVSLSYSFNIKH